MGRQSPLKCERLASVTLDSIVFKALMEASKESPSTLSVSLRDNGQSIGVADWHSFLPLLALKGRKALDMPLLEVIVKIPPILPESADLPEIARAVMEYNTDTLVIGDDECYTTLRGILERASKEYASSSHPIELRPGDYVVMKPLATI